VLNETCDIISITNDDIRYFVDCSCIYFERYVIYIFVTRSDVYLNI